MRRSLSNRDYKCNKRHYTNKEISKFQNKVKNIQETKNIVKQLEIKRSIIADLLYTLQSKEYRKIRKSTSLDIKILKKKRKLQDTYTHTIFTLTYYLICSFEFDRGLFLVIMPVNLYRRKKKNTNNNKNCFIYKHMKLL